MKYILIIFACLFMVGCHTQKDQRRYVVDYMKSSYQCSPDKVICKQYSSFFGSTSLWVVKCDGKWYTIQCNNKICVSK